MNVNVFVNVGMNVNVGVYLCGRRRRELQENTCIYVHCSMTMSMRA